MIDRFFKWLYFIVLLGILLPNVSLGQTASQLMSKGVSAELAPYLAGDQRKGNFVPATDNLYDLGTSTKEWKDLFIDGTAKVDTLTVDENATVAGTLGVTGAVGITGAVTARSTMDVTGALGVTGAVTARSTLDVTGAVGVTGAITARAGILYPAALYEAVNAAGTATGDGALAAGKFIHAISQSDETKVVTLPACAIANVGEVHTLLNLVDNKFLKVCPITGSTLNGGGSGVCAALSATGVGTNGTCFCQAAATWICG